MLVALDTNILLYEAGFNDDARRDRAEAIRAALGPERAVIATQVLGEVFHALVVKRKQERSYARGLCNLLRRSAIVHAASEAVFGEALILATDQKLQIWDALILCTAADAGCRILLSEDMQHGFVHRGVTVVNPFSEPEHPLLADALRHPG